MYPSHSLSGFSSILKLKGKFTQNEVMSRFIHPKFVSTLYTFVCSDEHKKKYFEKCKQVSVLGHH